MNRETTRFQALMLRRREGDLCARVRSIYLRIATREFGRKSCIPEESATEFEVEMWQDLKNKEWPFSDSTVDWIRYQAYVLVRRIKQRIKYSRGKEVELSEETLDYILYQAPSHEPGPEPQAELSELDQKIFRAAAMLSPLQHVVFYAVYREHKTVGEIAARIDKPSDKVSKALDKAEHRIRVLLERSGTIWDDARDVLNDVDRARR